MINRYKKITIVFAFLLLSLTDLMYAGSYPPTVLSALDKAGENRKELIQVLEYYAGDSIKYKAACFLISNMPAHNTQTYYWADSLDREEPFNEFDFPDFKTAVSHFNQISRTKKLHPVSVLKKDLETISASYLIYNIEKAFEQKVIPWACHLTFNQFCEYLLPYRFMSEPYGEWRTSFQKEYSLYSTLLTGTSVRNACVTICNKLRSSFFNTWVVSPNKVEPAYLSPAQILFRKQGACEDMANWGGYTFRSMGIATTIDYTPAWATSTGSHFWNVAFGEHGETIPFVMGSSDTPNKFYLHREPSKVLRITYSIQSSTLAQQISTENIPDGHLKASNYIDVTRDYWRVSDLSVRLERKSSNNKVAYVAVHNGSTWRTVWWGHIKKDKTIFSDLSCGAVYLPMLYENKKMVPAAYPRLLRKDAKVQILKPDENRLRSISITQEQNYLIFRPGKKYTLYYWKMEWQPLSTEIAKNNDPLVFGKVPSNALMLLIPEYSEGKERPFTISETGEREWW